MSCAELGSYLATQPHISQFVPPPPAAQCRPFTTLVAAAGTNAARCEANFIYSARGGPADGYAEGQNQRIVLRVGLPLNSMDGGAGGVQGAWNGKVQNLGGGGLAGNVGAVDRGHQRRLRRLVHRHRPYLGREPELRGDPGDARAELRQARRLPDREPAPAIPVGARAGARPTTASRRTRNYWNGCSTGGRQGLSLALNHGEDFDGFLVGAPANYNTRLQVTTLWPWWVQQGHRRQHASPRPRSPRRTPRPWRPATRMDGVTDGVLGDPRNCTFDAARQHLRPARRAGGELPDAGRSAGDQQDLGRPAQRSRHAHLVPVRARRQRRA